MTAFRRHALIAAPVSLLLAGLLAACGGGAVSVSNVTSSKSTPSASTPNASTRSASKASTASVAPTSAPPSIQSLAMAPPVGAQGAYLPASSVTPGAINPSVTQADIATTICHSGFTASIRPPVAYTQALKESQLAHGYAVGGDNNLAAYEEDHLIPLELGGSPTSVKNLWPEPWEHSTAHPDGFAKLGTGAQTKDRIEDSLRSRVCDGRITLATAQHMIATNWRAAFDLYIGGTTTTAQASPTAAKASATPTSTTSSALAIVHAGSFCSAAGATGVTSAGTPMVCRTSATDSRLRWRSAS